MKMRRRGVSDPLKRIKESNPDSPIVVVIEKLMSRIGFSIDESLVALYEIDNNGFDIVRRKE